MRVDDLWSRRFIALFNIGHAHAIEEEFVERCRLENLREELTAAEHLRDFKRIKKVQRAIRAEIKRQWQGPLTDLEKQVLKIHDLLHFTNGRPPTDAELYKRKSGWTWGCVSAVDCRGRTIFVADGHRHDGRRFIVRADEKLTAFAAPKRIGLKSHIRLSGVLVKVPSITSSDVSTHFRPVLKSRLRA